MDGNIKLNPDISSKCLKRFSISTKINDFYVISFCLFEQYILSRDRYETPFVGKNRHILSIGSNQGHPFHLSMHVFASFRTVLYSIYEKGFNKLLLKVR